MTGKLGYQIGLGYKVNKNFSAELGYTIVNYDTEGYILEEKTGSGEARNNTLSLSGNYHF